MNPREIIEALPKTDLHCHLDGSMRPETILNIAKKKRLAISNLSLEELKRKLVIGAPVVSLPVFLQAFDITCSVLQWPETISQVAFELGEDAAKENVRYLEIRFAPSLCTMQGLTMKEVLLAASQGAKDAEEKYRIYIRLIVCGLRNLDPKENERMAVLAADSMDLGVVGFDLAQAERGNPAKDHQRAFAIAKEAGLHRTVHAGEDYGPQSIHQALFDCDAERLGHGRTLIEDEELMKFVFENRIGIECCPSSNVQIQLTPSYAEHPAKTYLERGMLVSLNTDNRLLTGIRVTDEYLRCHENMGLSLTELVQFARNGFLTCFAETELKSKLITDSHREIEKLLSSSESLKGNLA